jgi:hypothetical protein
VALFTDGTIARLEDLRAYESAVLNLTSTESVDVNAKLELAQRELGTELLPFLARRGYRDLSNVVVTTPLLSAHALRTLATIYRDLYQSRYNDRYEGKWREYAAQSERATRALLEAGIGISLAPIPKAAPPTLETISGGLLPARTYYVSVAWVRGWAIGPTGALSEAVSVSVPPGGLMRVRVVKPPFRDARWVLYAGMFPNTLALQSEYQFDVDMHWDETDTGLRSDLPDRLVQTPDVYLDNRQEMLRG